MARCQKCGAELPEDGRVCEYCGSAAERPRPPDGDAREYGKYTEGSRRDGPVRFKRSSVTGMLLCTILTQGLYPGIWYILRLGSLKELDPALYKKTRWIIKAFIITNILLVCSSHNVIFSWRISAKDVVLYVFVFLWVCVSFAVRGLLRRYAERTSPGNPMNASVASSEFCLFLFGFLYLQTQINRMIDARLLEARL